MSENFINIRVDLKDDGTPVVTYNGELTTASADERVMMQLIGYGLFGMLEDGHVEVCKYGMKTIARMRENGTFDDSFTMEDQDEVAAPTHEGTMRAQ